MNESSEFVTILYLLGGFSRCLREWLYFLNEEDENWFVGFCMEITKNAWNTDWSVYEEKQKKKHYKLPRRRSILYRHFTTWS